MTKNPSFIAKLIIIGCIALFLISSWFIEKGNLPELWIHVLDVARHGFEGALVGGICDFIAVKNVYKAAHANFFSLRDHTAAFVITDMIKVREQVKKIANVEELLQDKNNQEKLISFLEELLPHKPDLNNIVQEFWQKNLREEIIAWAIQVNITTGLRRKKESHDIDVTVFQRIGAKCLKHMAQRKEENLALLNAIEALTEDLTLADAGLPSEEREVKVLLDHIWAHWKETGNLNEMNVFGLGNLSSFIIGIVSPRLAKLVKTTTVHQALDPLLTEDSVHQILMSFARKLEKESQYPTEKAEMFSDIVGYIDVFIQAWNHLPETDKRAVVEELIKAFEKDMIEKVVGMIWSWKTQLLDPQKIIEKKAVKELLVAFQKQVEQRSILVEEQALLGLQNQFDEMGPENFVELIRSRTQTQLDWIKVNGTIFGFGIGAVVGGIGLLFGL